MNNTRSDETLKVFGERVKKLREEKEFSVRDFANTVGIDPSTLYRIETGAANPQLTTILAIAATLKVDVSVLIKGLY